MHHISLQTEFLYEGNIVLIFILQIMCKMQAQYLIYSVLVHNSSIEICACIQNLLKNSRFTCIAQYTLFCIKTLFHSHLEMKFFRILTKKKSGWSLRSISGNPQVNFGVQNVAITFKWHRCLINVCVSCNSLQSTASVTLTRPPETQYIYIYAKMMKMSVYGIMCTLIWLS